MNKERFNELLQASLKSEDTEEWLDVHFNRPIGLMMALAAGRLSIKPNTITIVGILIGLASAVMFYHTGWQYNVAGMLLLMLSNFCDSADGQLARITNQKSLLGRALDGVSGDVVFAAIYVALCLRMQGQLIPFTSVHWGIGIWALAAVAGFICHSNQASLADYYRQIHLYFLLGKEGSELDNSKQQREIVAGLPKEKWFDRLFYTLYGNYCEKQEKRTPHFQRFFAKYRQQLSDGRNLSDIKQKMIDGGRPLMTYTNLLTFNSRAIALYITALLNCPWVYLLFEIIVLTVLYIRMHHTHEKLCEALETEL